MEWIALDKDALDVLLTVIQILTLIALIIYVKKTWDMAVSTEKSAKISEKTLIEMRDIRNDETAPYIVAYFELEDHSLHLIVENIGKGLAKNVKIEFDPKLECNGHDISETPLIKDGIPSMPPNYKIKTYFDTTVRYLKSGLPLSYNVKISYYGGLINTERTTEFVLDLTYIKGIHFVKRNRMHDLVKEIEDMKKVQIKILEKIK
jgi:hypothetical protein